MQTLDHTKVLIEQQVSASMRMRPQTPGEWLVQDNGAPGGGGELFGGGLEIVGGGNPGADAGLSLW